MVPDHNGVPEVHFDLDTVNVYAQHKGFLTLAHHKKRVGASCSGLRIRERVDLDIGFENNTLINDINLTTFIHNCFEERATDGGGEGR